MFAKTRMNGRINLMTSTVFGGSITRQWAEECGNDMFTCQCGCPCQWPFHLWHPPDGWWCPQMWHGACSTLHKNKQSFMINSLPKGRFEIHGSVLWTCTQTHACTPNPTPLWMHIFMCMYECLCVDECMNEYTCVWTCVFVCMHDLCVCVWSHACGITFLFKNV